MDRQEATELIEKEKSWNVGQKSVSLAFGGPRTTEDDILDARRQRLSRAYKVLEEI